ncbi:MAG: glycerophosphodiester phosphodiesterase [Bdellovibrionaceae bacterium]|nr:glycerophosphodiester phosphodiesterase [Pseudobdellovibrionaceae bacterium]
MKYPFHFLRTWIHPTPWPAESFVIPKFQSHRGYHTEGIQENTLAALTEARLRGAEMCEFDVQLTSEKTPVLFHDADLTKFTGEKKPLSSFSLSDLRAKFPITTLQEALESPLAPRFFNIELKTNQLDGYLSQQVAELIKQLNSEHRVMFSSFNPFALFLVSEFLPNVPRALLVTKEVSKENAWYLREMAFAPLLKIHMLNLDQEMLTPDEIQFWKQQQMPLSVWTVNDPNKINGFLEQGISSVISDLDPALIATLVDKIA